MSLINMLKDKIRSNTLQEQIKNTKTLNIQQTGQKQISYIRITSTNKYNKEELQSKDKQG